MTPYKNLFLTLLLLAGTLLPAAAQVEVAVLPEKDAPERSARYDVSVRAMEETTWHSLPVLRCDVNTRRVQQSAYAEFDMGGTVVVRVRSNEHDTYNPVVRPSARQIRTRRIDARTVEFTLTEPAYLSLEQDGDREHNLHILANSLLTERHTADEPQTIVWEAPNSQDVFVRNPRLIYFGPGVHRPKDLPGGDIKVPSNCTVYLAPGAVVKARLIVDHAENVRIVGRGILDHPLRGVEITYSKNVLVEGITVLNPAHYTIFGGESEDIVVRNVKAFSARSWTDGIDLMCCRRVKVENCFLRTSDDCIALYNHRWWYWGGTSDIDVARCVLWPDVAHPVNIGSHGDDRNPEGETLRHVRIHDCDILMGKEEGLLAINCGDGNHIRDVRFDRLRIEGIERGRLFDLRVIWSEKYNRAPGHCIDSITFADITVDQPSADILRPSRIDHYDADRRVGHVAFERVLLGGRKFDEQRDIQP